MGQATSASDTGLYVNSLALGALTCLLLVAMAGWTFVRRNSSRKPTESTSAVDVTVESAFLDKTEFRRFPLIEKHVINHNTALYRFQLPDATHGLGLPIGQHVSVRAVIDGKEVVRSYTPTSLNEDVGHFDLVIKSYPAGLLSAWFARLRLGDEIECRGPKGAFLYQPNMVKTLGMIAGGTGITPMLQVIQAIVRNPQDRTRIQLIFANVNEEDILLRETLDELAKSHAEQLSIFYVLNQAPEGWTGGVGFVSKDMIRDHCPAPGPDMKVLLCGPPPMIKAMQQHCNDLGYEKARVVSKPTDMVFKF